MAQKNESPFVGRLEQIIKALLPDQLTVVRGMGLQVQSGFSGLYIRN